MLIPVHHLVGPAEVMHMLGVSRQRVAQLAQRPDFPKPAAILAAGSVWHTAEIEAWAKSTGREIVVDDED